ncbi:NADPH-dependent FMN reductase [Pseudomonas sp. BGr12]|uniref:NADPH-dependent FMN reductase n=1 Tax=unclassified Pseudomonas TaxID=196821 RepID=UPI00177C4BDC|nr:MULTISPECIES: NAD(P)H-dependent oxidoreductase [unclassified Pseudomonas]MBD9504980.1 NAD(P)H-dependent oxidoreductase [Pseudomonas sp. PDM17]MBD9577800.1 NAD(P)H-dependent oxidoreductase [Pseudomonas sp. PDM23]MBD9672358.1 NAD(P)H-dependent oxidoreductase [Pseudomonas sp. PDM21]MDL2430531.1 NAD(P)H-dependent oxidoreductase [Pseudomonas sp. BJa5]
MNLNVTLIAGSSQASSQSAKVARYLAGRLQALEICTTASVVDLGRTPLPLWPAPIEDQAWVEQTGQLQRADALVVISPEWHGMACPALKNLFLYAGYAELAHKPALLVGVSAGLGGSYPLSELRASSYKNSRICYLPEQLVIRQVDQVFNGVEPAGEDDMRIRRRADWALRVLSEYAHGMRGLRDRIQLEHRDFHNGM